MHYLRITVDPDGRSVFEDVELPTTRRPSGISSAIAEVTQAVPVGGLVFRRVIVEHEDDRPHVAPRRQFVIHLQGEAEIEVSGGSTRQVGPGVVVLVEDTWGDGHITRRLGTAPRVTLMADLT